ncbi:MAG: hypothetical protein NW200_06895 [Hyphomonadaceae bacterium]|nr:hypothetical protein [Hyphomonadaceae bacterium]
MALRRFPRLMLPAVAAAMAASGCASTFSSQELARAPAWFKARQTELAGRGYPALDSVPAAPDVVKDAPRWAAVERDLRAAAASIEASPRSQPAPAVDTDADAFDKAAREAIDGARGPAAANAPAAEPARPQ